MKRLYAWRTFHVPLFALLLAAANVSPQTQAPPAKSPADGPILDASKISPNDGVVPPSCQYMPPPPYSKEARKAKYEGIVVVEGIINLDGKISDLRVVKSPGLGLEESVIKTLKKWKCTPAKEPDGKFVRTKIPFEMRFQLGSGN